MGGHRIPPTASARILGIHFQPRLGWSTHINHKIRSIQPAIAAFNRLARRPGPPRMKALIYTATIRSSLEYGHQVWADAPSWLIAKLKRIQNRCVKNILPTRGLNTNRRHKILKIPPFPERLQTLREGYVNSLFTDPKRPIADAIDDARYGQPRAYNSPATTLAKLLGPCPCPGRLQIRDNRRSTYFARRIVAASGTRPHRRRIRRQQRGLPPIFDDRPQH